MEIIFHPWEVQRSQRKGGNDRSLYMFRLDYILFGKCSKFIDRPLRSFTTTDQVTEISANICQLRWKIASEERANNS